MENIIARETLLAGLLDTITKTFVPWNTKKVWSSDIFFFLHSEDVFNRNIIFWKIDFATDLRETALSANERALTSLEKIELHIISEYLYDTD